LVILIYICKYIGAHCAHDGPGKKKGTKDIETKDSFCLEASHLSIHNSGQRSKKEGHSLEYGMGSETFFLD